MKKPIVDTPYKGSWAESMEQHTYVLCKPDMYAGSTTLPNRTLRYNLNKHCYEEYKGDL